MKRFWLLFGMLVIALTLVSGCQTVTGKTAGQTVDDATITTTINSKIVKDPQLSFLKIDVDTFQGNVTLSGQVPNEEARQRLLDLAKNTNGVKSVKSNLQVGAPQKK